MFSMSSKDLESIFKDFVCIQLTRYKITVETGHWFGSGTTATVVMRMYGEVNTSDPIELVAKDKLLFGRGSQDIFIFE